MCSIGVEAYKATGGRPGYIPAPRGWFRPYQIALMVLGQGKAGSLIVWGFLRSARAAFATTEKLPMTRCLAGRCRRGRLSRLSGPKSRPWQGTKGRRLQCNRVLRPRRGFSWGEWDSATGARDGRYIGAERRLPAQLLWVGIIVLASARRPDLMLGYAPALPHRHYHSITITSIPPSTRARLIYTPS
jgi:hypothetical protein